MSTPEKTRLGELLEQQRSQFQEAMPRFAARFIQDAIEPERTYINWAQGKNAPSNKKRAEIEAGIGWKPGSINRLLSGEGAFLSLTDVQDLPVEEQPVKRAADLSDDELLSEVTRRFKNYADKANDKATTPAQDRRGDFDLAANHPTTPKRLRNP